jgi:hypothetical protein
MNSKPFCSGASKSSFCIGQDGTLYAWGCNDYGVLGLGEGVGNCVPTPTRLDLPGSIVDFACSCDHTLALTSKKAMFISCSAFHSLVITSTGDLYTFGEGTSGQLGNGGYEDSMDPIHVPGKWQLPFSELQWQRVAKWLFLGFRDQILVFFPYCRWKSFSIFLRCHWLPEISCRDGEEYLFLQLIWLFSNCRTNFYQKI